MSKVIYKLKGTIDISEKQLESLTLLYQPLFTEAALSLYFSLIYNARYENEVEVMYLCRMLHVDVQKIERLREELERFGLVRTFEKENVLTLELCEPLRPQEFMKHPSFGRLFSIVMGTEAFKEYSRRYNQSFEVEGKDISKSFDISRLEIWNEESESLFKTNAKSLSIKKSYDSRFFQDLPERVFPSVLRTPEVVKTVLEFGEKYNVSHNDLKSAVMKATNFEKMVFNIRQFQIIVDRQFGRQSVDTVSNPYELDSLSFLSYKQENNYIIEADRKLIESLRHNFKLSDPTINVLVEYILETNGMSLPKNYVEKIASTWQRKGIHGIEGAKGEIEASRNASKTRSTFVKTKQEVRMPEYTKPEAQSGVEDADAIDKRIQSYFREGER